MVVWLGVHQQSFSLWPIISVMIRFYMSMLCAFSTNHSFFHFKNQSAFSLSRHICMGCMCVHVFANIVVLSCLHLLPFSFGNWEIDGVLGMAWDLGSYQRRPHWRNLRYNDTGLDVMKKNKIDSHKKLVLMFYILIHTNFTILLKSLKHISSLENFYKHKIHITSFPLLFFYYVKDTPLLRYFSEDYISSPN